MHGLYAVLHWDVDQTPAPRIHQRRIPAVVVREHVERLLHEEVA